MSRRDMLFSDHGVAGLRAATGVRTMLRFSPPPPVNRTVTIPLPAAKGSVGQWHFGECRLSEGNHEEPQPGLVALDAALTWRCREASYPRSRPDFSRQRRPASKPLFAGRPHRGMGSRHRLWMSITSSSSGDAWKTPP